MKNTTYIEKCLKFHAVTYILIQQFLKDALCQNFTEIKFILFIVTQSQQNFAHATEALLSWHVQNLYVIEWFIFEFYTLILRILSILGYPKPLVKRSPWTHYTNDIFYSQFKFDGNSALL